MNSVSVTLEAPDLARILGNALAFIPAASRIKSALLDIRRDRVYTCGTDRYAAGRDEARVNHSDGVPAEGIPLLVSKESLAELDKAARQAKKAIATLTVTREGTVALDSVDVEPIIVPWFTDDHLLGTFEAVEQVLERVAGKPPAWPGVLMLDPSLMSRFAKVKADKPGRHADLHVPTEQAPILIKIGPTFRGLLQPVDRTINGKNIGEDGLW